MSSSRDPQQLAQPAALPQGAYGRLAGSSRAGLTFGAAWDHGPGQLAGKRSPSPALSGMSPRWERSHSLQGTQAVAAAAAAVLGSGGQDGGAAWSIPGQQPQLAQQYGLPTMPAPVARGNSPAMLSTLLTVKGSGGVKGPSSSSAAQGISPGGGPLFSGTPIPHPLERSQSWDLSPLAGPGTSRDAATLEAADLIEQLSSMMGIGHKQARPLVPTGGGGSGSRPQQQQGSQPQSFSSFVKPLSPSPSPGAKAGAPLLLGRSSSSSRSREGQSILSGRGMTSGGLGAGAAGGLQSGDPLLGSGSPTSLRSQLLQRPPSPSGLNRPWSGGSASGGAVAASPSRASRPPGAAAGGGLPPTSPTKSSASPPKAFHRGAPPAPSALVVGQAKPRQSQPPSVKAMVEAASEAAAVAERLGRSSETGPGSMQARGPLMPGSQVRHGPSALKGAAGIVKGVPWNPRHNGSQEGALAGRHAGAAPEEEEGGAGEGPDGEEDTTPSGCSTDHETEEDTGAESAEEEGMGSGGEEEGAGGHSGVAEEGEEEAGEVEEEEQDRSTPRRDPLLQALANLHNHRAAPGGTGSSNQQGASSSTAPRKPPKHPMAAGSGAGAAGGEAPAFWGGQAAKKPASGKAKALTAERLAQLPEGNKWTGRRPSTASSFWSQYDLDDGALEKAAAASKAAAQAEKARKAVKQRPASQGGALVKSNSLTRKFNSSAAPTKKAEPYLRVLHPAVVMDLSLLTPASKPVPEVPHDEKGRPYPYVLPPTFPGAYPTIAFMGPAERKQAAGLHPLMRVRMFVKYAGIANSPVKAAFKEAGWAVTKGKRWSVCWGHIFSAQEFARLHEFQRVNHFPGTWELGRKDHLYRNMAALKRRKGDLLLDMVPRFFILPRDYDEFKADLDRNPGRLYIQKPVNSSRGRGVRMVTKPAEMSRDVKDVLVQHYIHNPYTINGYKFDMRIYVAVTSFDPLRAYVYYDGLARFATEQYSDNKEDLKRRCVHLTNYSVNKKSEKFVANAGDSEDAESHGSKWSLTALHARIEEERGEGAWRRVWRQVHDIIAAALIAAEPRINTEVKIKVPHRNVCFEVWGFDIMLDDALRAWLIEVNTCPALAADTPLDRRVKTSMISDVMNLVGPVPYDYDAYEDASEAARQARLTGLPAGGAVGGPGAGPKAPPSGAAQLPRTLREAEELDLRGLAPDQLPDVVIEAEAEYARRGGWERVFPCLDDPCRYLELFETPRASNIVLCKYYAQKAGKGFAPGWPARAQTPSGPSARARPSINDWRPGGAA